MAQAHPQAMMLLNLFFVCMGFLQKMMALWNFESTMDLPGFAGMDLRGPICGHRIYGGSRSSDL